ncbi:MULTISPECIES: hypothetical protein [Mycolicibacterium]|uniref:hypothetical protein n=1 Tax=Mycolicibacterium TaxID=1866885 RepID=UPI00262B309B|nr:hypothetical protein [Mycolicibacterium fortuitum]
MGERLQFCRAGDDITAEITAERDADEVRVWADDGVRVAVSQDNAGAWSYAGSDFGAEPTWDIDDTFDSWRDALQSYGFTELLP